MSEIFVIVLGGSTNALGQIRAAHKVGYKCINLAESGLNCFSRKSRYCEGHIVPHPYLEKEKCLSSLIFYINRCKSKPFIFTDSDEWLCLVGENEQQLKGIAYIPQSPWNEMSQLFNKKYLYRIADKYHIPYPKTIEIDDLSELNNALTNIQVPFIIKPQDTNDQNQIVNSGIEAYHRTQRFDDIKDALSWASNLANNGVNFPVLIQEFIPGDATQLYTLTSYSNNNGELLSGSIGHKLRQFPPSAGRITSGVLKHNDELMEYGSTFLKAVNYHGLANTEFKYDIRDGKYKLMEINTRLGAWNYSALYSGVNLIEVAVCDTLGIEYNSPKYSTKYDGHIWYNLLLDLGCAIFLNGKVESKRKMTIREWRHSFNNKKFEAIWDIKDPAPFIYYVCHMVRKFIIGR